MGDNSWSWKRAYGAMADWAIENQEVVQPLPGPGERGFAILFPHRSVGLLFQQEVQYI